MNNYEKTYNVTEYFDNSNERPNNYCYQIENCCIHNTKCENDNSILNNLPYKSNFTRENYLASHFDTGISTSISSSDSYEIKTKILSGCSFQAELKKELMNKKNKNINLIPNKASYLENPKVDSLIEQIKELKNITQCLKEECQKFKIENSALVANNNELSNALNKITNDYTNLVNENTELKKMIEQYQQMLNLDFNFFKSLSQLINEDRLKLNLNENDGYKLFCNDKEKHQEIISNFKERVDQMTQLPREEIRINQIIPQKVENTQFMKYKTESKKRKSKSKNKELNEISQLHHSNNTYDYNIKKINDDYNNDSLQGNCFACNVGCNISNSGYSPMTYSPYEIKKKRKAITPINCNN